MRARVRIEQGDEFGVGLAHAAVAGLGHAPVLLRDELDRSMKQLQLEKMEKPYFIAYRITEVGWRRISATFGAI